MRHVASATRLSMTSCLVAATAMVGASQAKADPLYTLEALIPVPATSANLAPGGAFTTYDISYFDGNTQTYYLGDRSNGVVDVFSAAFNTFQGQIGLGQFSGIQPPPPAPANNDISGPNGVVVLNSGGQHVLYAGNGDSTLKVFNLNAPGNPLITSVATGTPDQKRVDEMAIAPSINRLVVANNAADTPFLTVINTQTNAIVTKIAFDGTNGTPNATNGLEQAVWDPTTQKFYVSVPQVNGTGPGGIARIDPTTNKVDKFYDLTPLLGAGGACSPAGLAVSGSGTLAIGCGVASQSVLLDPKANGGNGSFKIVSQVSGEDMVWYDPKTGRFFFAARLNPGGPVLGIVDAATGQWLENISTTPGDHSVAVDPVSGEIFVPFGGVAGNDVCPNGCIAVYGLVPVPEPRSISMLGVSLLGLTSLVWYRRRRS